MKKLLKLFKYLLECIFIGLPAFISAMLTKIFVHDLWLVGECGKFARDNGFWFFKYIKENHPNQKVVFVLSKKSPDYQKVKALGKVCGYQTFAHWFYYFLCSKEITTNPHCKPGYYINKNLWFNKTYFLQHGITRDFVPVYSSKQLKLKMFVTSAKPEHDFIVNNFGYSKDVVKLLGFTRYDNLLNVSVNENQILIMPTWREYLRNVNENEFINSEYYVAWKNLLEDKALNNILKQNNKYVIFYLHRELQKFTHLFNETETVIVAKSKDYDIQTLLKESALLVTDYSSVFFDFAYMKKPVIWYLFDKDTYFKNHHKKGYFKEEESPLGEVTLTQDDLIKRLQYYCNNQFKLTQQQINGIETFYAYYDNKNCERTYKAIKGEKRC